ncbi:leucine-rich repeat extensin-like protein 2 isoform X2 [Xiphias gladius]|uniref:leucine-rich repeat extensin-like protein 2 isoform X2 n=1 Tax=Xiphias gladius TaxID=8245 RepID=UPI001A99CD8D|nr:leucine-rich repeat extensin-like protein 2 isoform X2 [Xiphias gladius]
MAGEAGRSCRSCQTVAVLLLLCSLAPSLTCSSLRGMSERVQRDEAVSEAAVMEVRKGNILFNGKELNSESGSASAAAPTKKLKQTSQLKDAMANEAAWRRLNPTLHCGQTKMKLKAMGPGAANLQLDTGNARPLPLIRVPEACGYSRQQNALGLVLVVPYDGCNVIRENGNYVVPMSWLETPVKLMCPISKSPGATPASTTPKPAQHPLKLPFPHRPRNLYRHKRQVNQPYSIYDPRNPYAYWYYYMYMMRPAPSTAPPSTTKPDTTTVTTKPATEKPQINPPAYPYYLYYPFYPYYPYYPYYPLPKPPATTTVPPATTTVPPATTTGPGTTLMTTAIMTTSASTTKTPQKPSIPNYPPYFPYYPYYPPAGHQLPENPDSSEIYYYPIIQHFYGKPPYPENPSQPMQTTRHPTPTTKPGDISKPSQSSPTLKSTTASGPTTASAPTAQTTKPCSHTTTPSSSGYPGPMSPYVPYHMLPFTPYVSYEYNKAGKLPYYQKYGPHSGYKSGLQAQAHPHPGFHYWQPVPWFPAQQEKTFLKLTGKNPQPK